VIDDDMVIVGGWVPSRSFAARVLARAESIAGDHEVVSDLRIDPGVVPELGVLVVVDQLRFESDRAHLDGRSAQVLDLLADVAHQFDEVTTWAYDAADRPMSEVDAIELSRERVAALISTVEGERSVEATVRVQVRNRGLVEGLGENPEPRPRRYQIRLRRGS
jgi:YD repeat-containing protein